MKTVRFDLKHMAKRKKFAINGFHSKLMKEQKCYIILSILQTLFMTYLYKQEVTLHKELLITSNNILLSFNQLRRNLLKETKVGLPSCRKN